MMRPDIAIAYLWATVERRACITFATSCTVGLFRRWRSARVTCVQQITLRSALLDALSAANDRIELEVDDALLERNQGVVGDLDVLGAHIGAALGDVAEAEAMLVLCGLLAVDSLLRGRIERMHVELGHPHQEAWSGEGCLVLLVISNHVAGVLAQEALNALAELLRPLHID